MTPIQVAVLCLEAKQAEAANLTGQLRMWADVEAQGIDSSEGGTFTWKDEWEEKRRVTPRLPGEARTTPPNPSTHYNAIKLPGGDWQRLNPPVRKP